MEKRKIFWVPLKNWNPELQIPDSGTEPEKLNSQGARPVQGSIN